MLAGGFYKYQASYGSFYSYIQLEFIKGYYVGVRLTKNDVFTLENYCDQTAKLYKVIQKFLLGFTYKSKFYKHIFVADR